jgi:hypothetical protein
MILIAIIARITLTASGKRPVTVPIIPLPTLLILLPSPPNDDKGPVDVVGSVAVGPAPPLTPPNALAVAVLLGTSVVLGISPALVVPLVDPLLNVDLRIKEAIGLPAGNKGLPAAKISLDLRYDGGVLSNSSGP